MKYLYNDEQSIEVAAAFLKSSEVVAFPTETVYGLGASILCDQAIERLYQTKQRSHTKPFTAHISDLSQVQDIAVNVPDEFFQLAQHFFPGPLTIVVKKNSQVSSLVTGGLDTIGIRMPNHPIAIKLIQKAGCPIAATSANISGQPSILKKEQLIEEFGHIAAFIDGGVQPCGIASTVISLVDPKNPILLRQGSILLEDLMPILSP